MKKPKTKEEAKLKILKRVNELTNVTGLPIDSLCSYYLHDVNFLNHSGSHEEGLHHYGDGGLIIHTCEVLELCFSVCKYYEGEGKIDPVELFLAAFFHDLGKLHDYEWHINYDINGVMELGRNVVVKDHRRYVRHINRSAIIWSEECNKCPEIYEKYYESVLHAILSHHGVGYSPVAPLSRVSWILHLCDGISARNYDADTLDVLDRPD